MYCGTRRVPCLRYLSDGRNLLPADIRDRRSRPSASHRRDQQRQACLRDRPEQRQFPCFFRKMEQMAPPTAAKPQITEEVNIATRTGLRQKGRRQRQAFGLAGSLWRNIMASCPNHLRGLHDRALIVSIRCGSRGFAVAMGYLVWFANNLIRISRFCFWRTALERRERAWRGAALCPGSSDR